MVEAVPVEEAAARALVLPLKGREGAVLPVRALVLPLRAKEPAVLPLRALALRLRAKEPVVLPLRALALRLRVNEPAVEASEEQRLQTAFPLLRLATPDKVLQICRSNPGPPTSSRSGWPTTAKTIPTRIACRWASCSFTRIRSREKSSRLPARC